MSDTLFKFFGFRDFDLDALCNSYLWFSKLHEFNDPFEGLYEEQVSSITEEEIDVQKFITTLRRSLISEGLTQDEIQPYIAKYTNNKWAKREILENYQSIERGLKVLYQDHKKRLYCSFTQDSEGNQNKLLWSHYGFGLSGFCLEFYQSALVDSIAELNEKAEIVYTGEIHYREAKIQSIQERLLLVLGEQSYDSPGEVLNRKCIEWDYEKEFRLSVEYRDDRKLIYHSSLIKSITIGEKMSKVKRETLFMCLKGLLGVTWKEKVKVASICKKTFKIIIEPLNR
ncbi:DUF2971 domain-containing protein [Shewanella benthica]|nr:DUF2971 domain-containing protein [Shewanella benthica]